MNFPRVSSLTKKEQKKLLREPAALFLIILFPIALTLAFGVSFGAVGGTSATTYQVGVINADVSPNHSWSQHFVANLAASQILKVTMYRRSSRARRFSPRKNPSVDRHSS